MKKFGVYSILAFVPAMAACAIKDSSAIQDVQAAQPLEFSRVEMLRLRETLAFKTVLKCEIYAATNTENTEVIVPIPVLNPSDVTEGEFRGVDTLRWAGSEELGRIDSELNFGIVMEKTDSSVVARIWMKAGRRDSNASGSDEIFVKSASRLETIVNRLSEPEAVSPLSFGVEGRGGKALICALVAKG